MNSSVEVIDGMTFSDIHLFWKLKTIEFIVSTEVI